MSLSSSNADLPGVHLNSVVNAPHQFSYESGVLVTRVEPGFAQGVLEVGPNSINPHGKVHGYHLSVIQVELTNVSGETVATGTFTFFMSHS